MILPKGPFGISLETVALLERIIQASSNEGDVVFDPFYGCGMTIAAAQS